MLRRARVGARSDSPLPNSTQRTIDTRQTQRHHVVCPTVVGAPHGQHSQHTPHHSTNTTHTHTHHTRTNYGAQPTSVRTRHTTHSTPNTHRTTHNTIHSTHDTRITDSTHITYESIMLCPAVVGGHTHIQQTHDVVPSRCRCAHTYPTNTSCCAQPLSVRTHVSNKHIMLCPADVGAHTHIQQTHHVAPSRGRCTVRHDLAQHTAHKIHTTRALTQHSRHTPISLFPPSRCRCTHATNTTQTDTAQKTQHGATSLYRCTVRHDARQTHRHHNTRIVPSCFRCPTRPTHPTHTHDTHQPTHTTAQKRHTQHIAHTPKAETTNDPACIWVVGCGDA